MVERILKATVIILLLVFSVLVVLNIDETDSQSGSNQYLRENGTYLTTRKYDNDTLFYTSKNGTYSRKELKALTMKSKYYIIVIK